MTLNEAVHQTGEIDTRFAAGAGFIDGDYVPIDEARIPIVDAGFSRSDVTYDVVGVWDGAFFRLGDHLARFEASCAALRMSLPHARNEVEEILHELVRRTGLTSSYVEVICTRGVPPTGLRDPRTFRNRFYAYAVPYIWILPAEDAETGMDAIITQTVKRIPSSSVDPTVKNFHWGDLTRGLFEAYDRGARYPVLLDAEGNVTEGAGYNVFALIDGTLATPATGALEGITRRTVLELAGQEGISVTQGDISADAFRNAAELFATSTAGGVMPITSLDGRPVGSGHVGDMTRRLRDAYWAAHHDPRYVTPVVYRGRSLTNGRGAAGSTSQ